MIEIGPVRWARTPSAYSFALRRCSLEPRISRMRPRSKSPISAYDTREIFSLALPPFPRLKADLPSVIFMVSNAASSSVLFMVSTP